jgi:NADPH:quinone reductase
MREATRLARAAQLDVIVDPRRFTLETAAQAHAALEAGNAEGKLVIDIP